MLQDFFDFTPSARVKKAIKLLKLDNEEQEEEVKDPANFVQQTNSKRRKI